MAASAGRSEGTELSKAEYLKRYLSTDEDAKKSKGKLKKKRSKVPERGLKIVDDDIDWKQMVAEEQEDEEDEEEAPVVAEMIDDRPEEVKQLEAFRTGNRWKVIGADEDNDSSRSEHDSPDASPTRRDRHDSPDISPAREGRHDSLDISSPRRDHHDSPDLSPSRQHSKKSGKGQSKDSSPTGRQPSKKRSPDPRGSPLTKRDQNKHDSDSDQSPPRKKVEATDLDQSPPRRRSKRKQEPDTDQSPPRRRPKSGRDSDEDLSPPRRPGQSQGMLSGRQSGLVSVDVLRKEKEENRRRDRKHKPLEEESCNAQTVFRDKSGKRRDLESERDEQKIKAGEKAAKDEKYAQWGRGLAQGQMHQQNLEDAMHEVHKPLARHSDDKDLDRMLREQERDGDPMAAMLRRKKVRSNTPAKPQYKGPPPPPNRFNLPPGYRWDGVDRSNGFEKKRYSRIADKKAVQDAAYKWSVEDM